VRATIVGIYVGSKGEAPLHAERQGVLVAGKGLVGDRYYDGVGSFSKPAIPPDAELTLIEIEEIERFNAELREPFPIGAFRRSVVTQGIRLNDLVGKRFSVGGAVLEGKRLCEPCSHLAKLTTQSIVSKMAHRAGLRAQIISGGAIAVGDSIEA